MMIRGLPAPRIRAPIALSMLARSTTSGSQAAHSMIVWPSARVAADITFAVPSTVDPNAPPRNTREPLNRPPLPPGTRATMSP